MAPPRRILFLTKRLYMGKDLIADRYGRFRELPLELARLGHEVRGICFSYRSRPAGEVDDEGVAWTSLDLGRAVLPGLLRYRRETLRIAEEFRPDVVIAASDAFHAIWGLRLARRVGARSITDLYDNFESYAGTRLPLIHRAFRRAVRETDLLCCISAPLERYVTETYGRTGPTMVLENGVRRDLFHPADQREARARLGLPQEAKLIGAAGALARSRDIETLFRAADLLAARDANIRLAVAGPRDDGLVWPKVATVHDLGLLAHEQVPDLLNALDVVAVPNRDSAFGAFCHPQKAVEAAACERPFVAANVGAMAELLAKDPGGLYDVGDAESLADALAARLVAPVAAQAQVQSWGGIAARLAGKVRDGFAAPGFKG